MSSCAEAKPRHALSLACAGGRLKENPSRRGDLWSRPRSRANASSAERSRDRSLRASTSVLRLPASTSVLRRRGGACPLLSTCADLRPAPVGADALGSPPIRAGVPTCARRARPLVARLPTSVSRRRGASGRARDHAPTHHPRSDQGIAPYARPRPSPAFPRPRPSRAVGEGLVPSRRSAPALAFPLRGRWHPPIPREADDG